MSEGPEPLPVRRAVLRGLLAAALLGLCARLALESPAFALSSSAYALLYFHTVPGGALPWIGAAAGAWVLLASLGESWIWNRWDPPKPSFTVLAVFVLSVVGLLVATIQGTYTHGLLADGLPGKALQRAYEQGQQVVRLMGSFPRDTASLLTTFALPVPLVLWFRRGEVSWQRQLVLGATLSTVLVLALYTPLLPEPSTKVVQGSLQRVTPLQHWFGWWALVSSYVGVLLLAVGLADAVERTIMGRNEEAPSAPEG